MTMSDAEEATRHPRVLKALTCLSIGLSIVSVVWLLFATAAVLDIQTWVDNPGPGHDLLGLGLLVTFLAHLVLLATILVVIRTVNQVRLLASTSLLLCSASTVFLLLDWACFHDIVKELPAGIDISGELSVLRLGLAVHYVYLLCQIALSVSFLSGLKNLPIGKSTRSGEDLFNAVHALGFVCACVGLTITAKMSGLHIPAKAWQWSVLPVLAVVFLPYVFVFLSWLYRARKEADSGLMDEKQKADLFKAGTTTWIASMPITVGLFAVAYGDPFGPWSVLWLPAHLFSSLLVFSAGTLFFFRRA